MDSNSLIEVQGVTVEFNRKTVLNGISLSVRKGESLVIAGPSGCGKSVFLKTMLGLIECREGTIRIAGTDIVDAPRPRIMELRSKIGMVFQNSALFDSLMIWENVGFFFLHHSSLAEDLIREKAIEALKAVDLTGVEDLLPEQLSGGMKKRVSIARALISNPEILCYDEPTTGLDPITSENITRLMEKIHKQFSTTDIVVTHDVKLASRIADRIALLENGEVADIGTFEELRGTSKNPLIISYLEAFGNSH